MSPTTILHQGHCGTAAWSSLAGMAGVYPGWGGVPGVGGGLGGSGGCTTGTQAQPSQVPIFSHYSALSPTYGQMKLFLVFLMRFPR